MSYPSAHLQQALLGAAEPLVPGCSLLQGRSHAWKEAGWRYTTAHSNSKVC